MPRDPYQWSMGSTGKSRTHQLSGTQSSFPSIADLCLTLFRTTYPTSDRQHNCHRLHKPQVRYTISDSVRSGNGALGVVPSEEDNRACRAYPRTKKCQSRRRIRMMNQEIFQALEMKWGPFDVDLNCSKAQQTSEEILQFQARPRSGSSRCPSPAMDEHHLPHSFS